MLESQILRIVCEGILRDLGLFIFGMRIMSDRLKRVAGNGRCLKV